MVCYLTTKLQLIKCIANTNLIYQRNGEKNQALKWKPIFDISMFLLITLCVSDLY
jgi:hypothetical protein